MRRTDKLSKVCADVVLEKIKKLVSVATQLKEIVKKEVPLHIMSLGHPCHWVEAILDIAPVISHKVMPL